MLKKYFLTILTKAFLYVVLKIFKAVYSGKGKGLTLL